MPPRSPRGHSPSRSRSPPARTRSRSMRRSRSRSDSRPRSDSRSRSASRGRTRSRSPERRGYRGPVDSRSRSRSRSPSRTPSPSRSAKIVVEKLTKNVTEGHLREIFGSFGDIEHLDLPLNRAFMTNRGTAYIVYHDPADAEAAIAHMHEAQLDGAILNVSIILPRRNFSRSPPPPSRGGRGYRRGSYAKSPPRRAGRGRGGDRHDVYRPQSVSRSRSRSPVRARSYSRSRSRSPIRRGSNRPKSPRQQRRRRSPSYSSYDDYSSRGGRTPSPERSRGNRH